MKLPILNKKNWKKVLRELPISKYPSLPDNLIKLREKLINKEEIVFSEEVLGYARISKYFEDYSREINNLYIKTINYNKFDKRPPMEHQKPATEFLLKNNKCILGDQAGAGKTGSSIYAALTMDDKFKILIITLKSLKYNFAKEISYLDNRYVVIDKKWDDSKFIIVHYDALKKWEKEISKIKFDIIIVDEAHKFRNPKTKVFGIFSELLKSIQPQKIWLLTGTPIGSRPSEYFNLLRIIKHPVTKNWQTYMQRYCAAKLDQWGRWDTKGASNLEELYEKISDVFLRRNLDEIGIELPKKYRETIFLELKDKKGYYNCIDDYQNKKYELLEPEQKQLFNDYTEVDVQEMTKMVLWRQYCALQKISDGSLLELIENILEEDETNKILVFTNFTCVIDTIVKHYKEKSCFVDGRILNAEKRLEIVDEFNNNPNKKVMALNIAAGGVGLNIQSANYTIMNDMAFVPSDMIQAEGRNYRIGQKRDVHVIYPLYDDTIEVPIYNMIESKMKIVSTITEGKEESYFHNDEEIQQGIKEENKIQTKKEILAEIFKQLK